jgi:hypothetical protein
MSALVMMTKNITELPKSKQIDVAHHFVRNRVMCKEVVLKLVSSEEQQAGVLTEALLAPKFVELSSATGVKESQRAMVCQSMGGVL